MDLRNHNGVCIGGDEGHDRIKLILDGLLEDGSADESLDDDSPITLNEFGDIAVQFPLTFRTICEIDQVLRGKGNYSPAQIAPFITYLDNKFSAELALTPHPEALLNRFLALKEAVHASLLPVVENCIKRIKGEEVVVAPVEKHYLLSRSQLNVILSRLDMREDPNDSNVWHNMRIAEGEVLHLPPVVDATQGYYLDRILEGLLGIGVEREKILEVCRACKLDVDL